MSDSAKRRIKGGGQGPGRKGARPPGPTRDGVFSLPVLVIVSATIHALLLAAFVYLPGLLPHGEKPLKLYSVTMTTLPPGPAGGGGSESVPVKPEPKPEVRPPEPEKEPVKIPLKPQEKKPSRKEEQEAAPAKPKAPVGPGQGPVGGGKEGQEVDGPVTLEGGIEFPYRYYIDALRRKVGGRWRPPELSARKKPSVVIFFRIDRKGRFSDIRVESSSGIGIVDRSALSAVSESSPLDGFPQEFEGDSIGVHYTFIVGEGK